jgi:hypothetical protein
MNKILLTSKRIMIMDKENYNHVVYANFVVAEAGKRCKQALASIESLADSGEVRMLVDISGTFGDPYRMVGSDRQSLTTS